MRGIQFIAWDILRGLSNHSLLMEGIKKRKATSSPPEDQAEFLDEQGKVPLF
jgi:hypothetical protein